MNYKGSLKNQEVYTRLKAGGTKQPFRYYLLTKIKKEAHKALEALKDARVRQTLGVLFGFIVAGLICAYILISIMVQLIIHLLAY